MLEPNILFLSSYIPIPIMFENSLDQASFDHVKVGPMPVLAVHNLWCQIHMFLDILEFKVENKTKIFRIKLFN